MKYENYELSENDINKIFRYLLISSFLRAISLSIPLIMISVNTNISLPLTLLSFIPFLQILIHSENFVLFIEFVYNVVLRPVVYIIALITTIQADQDFISIIFYTLFALQIINIIKHFLFSLISIFSSKY